MVGGSAALLFAPNRYLMQFCHTVIRMTKAFFLLCGIVVVVCIPLADIITFLAVCQPETNVLVR